MWEFPTDLYIHICDLSTETDIMSITAAVGTFEEGMILPAVNPLAYFSCCWVFPHSDGTDG
jgi:hypothetical protein